MALQIQFKKQISKNDGGIFEAAGISIPSEITFNASYVRVTSIVGTKSKIGFTAVVLARVDGIEISRNDYSFQPDLTGGNFIQQAYNHLKTLPEFAGAVDC
jgi:hypothetical protein